MPGSAAEPRADPVFRRSIADPGTALSAVQAELADFLAEAGVAPRAASRAAVVLEEVAANAFRHGGARAVRLEAAAAPPACRLVIEDDGAAFDPTAVALPIPARTLEEAPIGGRGVLILHRFAAGLAWHRTAGWNRLELTVATP